MKLVIINKRRNQLFIAKLTKILLCNKSNKKRNRGYHAIRNCKKRYN